MADYQFLHGRALSQMVKDVCAGDDVRCAVAFLGQDVRRQLFPNGIDSVQIMCDISMKCTSRWALWDFGAPRRANHKGNDNLRVFDGLHGKVYISLAGAVIGSPNMSTRGLGRTLEGDWNLETGVFCPPGGPVWNAALAWFDTQYAGSRAVGWDDVKRAQMAANDAGRPPSRGELQGLSLLQRIAAFPNAFGDTLFMLTEEDLDDEDESRLLEEDGHQKGAGIEVVVWDADLPRTEHAGLVIGFHLPDEGGWRIDGYTASASSAKDELLIFGRDDWSGIKRALHQPDLPKRLTRGDRLILEQLRTEESPTYDADGLAHAIRKAQRTVNDQS